MVITNHSGESTLIDLINASDRRHTSENLVDLILPVIDASGIPKNKFNCMVTDEASNIRVARETICENFDGHLLHYRCMAHVFNLMIGYMCSSRPIKVNIKKLVDLINKISLNKFLLNHLRTQGASMPSKIVATRWYSTSSAVNSILDLEQALMDAIHNPNLRVEAIKETVEDDTFWRSLKSLKRYLDKLSEMIGKVEASDSRLSDGFHLLLIYLRYLCIEIQADSPYRDIALEAAISQWNKLDIDLLLTAYVLDPNHSMRFLTKYALEKANETLLTMLIEMGHEPFIVAAMKQEVERYKIIVQSIEPSNVWEWWRQSDLSILRTVGIRMAACHASTANTERIFSGLAATITPSRNRLNLGTAFDLISLRINLLSRQKRAVRRRTSSPQPSQSMLESEPAEEIIDGLELDIESSLEIVGENFQSLATQQLELDETPAYREFKKIIDFSLEHSAASVQLPIQRIRISSREQAHLALRGLLDENSVD